MGILKLLLNLGNADGIREAMRISYKRARSSDRISMSPHVHAMVAALGSRYVVNGLLPPEDALWEECAPFLAFRDEEVAIAALSEYVVYKERPFDAKVDRLKEVLSRGMSELSAADSGIRGAAVAGFRAGYAWVHLLNPVGVSTIQQEADRLQRDHEAWIASITPVHCESSEGRSALRRAITSRRAINLIRLGSDLEETVVPHEMRFVSGADCLIAFSPEKQTRATYPLHLYALHRHEIDG